MKETTKKQIYQLVKGKLQNKIDNYKPESEHKPFFSAIFSEDKIITASLVHSFYTSFGMSIYEQIAILLAKDAGFDAERQYCLKGDIDLGTEHLITEMWNNDKDNGCKSKLDEIEKIRKSIYPAKDIKQYEDSTVDLFIKKPSGEEYFIDVKTVKANKGEFQIHKLKLLRWVGYRLSVDKHANVSTYLALPYNPYHPQPYLEKRGFGKSLDGKYDILVQDDFWNLVGGSNSTYTELIEIFKEVGKDISTDINNKFNS